MHASRLYHIRLEGLVEQEILNARSPLQVHVEPAGSGATHLHVQTDQSGLMGLLRYLHGLGFTLLAVSRHPVETAAGKS